MADIQLNRISKFFGGLSSGDRDKKDGVCLNIEEFDIFSNPSYMEPTTIFSADSVITNAVSGYTKDDGNNAFALGRDTSGTPNFKIWKKTVASADSPGAWAAYYTSSVQSATVAPIIWHKWDTAATSWLYIVTGSDSATTRTIYRVSLPATGTVSSTDSGATTMTLTGFAGSFDRCPAVRVSGELFFGNGPYIAKIDKDGAFTEKAFTLPRGWLCVSFTSIGDELAILAKSVETGENTSKLFFWDLTATTGVDDEVTIPMGGPQIVINHTEILRVIVAKNNILRTYQLLGKIPTKTHELTNVASETDTQPVIPDTSKFLKDNILYFGLWKTDKSGLYALGKVDDTSPLALILAKRFTTTDYSLHKPMAAYATGPNWFVSYDDNGTKSLAKLEDNNSPTRSSNAVYESVWVDAGSPETVKSWIGVFTVSKPVPNNCNIKIDARVDNASNYDSNSLVTLDSTNYESVYNTTADTFWGRDWTSLEGRVIQIRIRCTSSSTSKPTIYLVSFLSRTVPLI